jgi:prepilin-type N-terminal cleavage/methylation domain-containing protein
LHRRGLSLIELVVCIAVVAVLLGILLPALSRARQVANRSVCANNLRQIGIGWMLYVQDNNDRLPRHDELPDWKYGGVEFAGPDRTPILAQSRPINKYIEEQAEGTAGSLASALFRCPSDVGIFMRGSTSAGQPGMSILAGGTCWNEYGNSYRANELLLDASLTSIDRVERPLALHEIMMTHSKVLLTGDPAWFFATRQPKDTDASREATWHGTQDAGNMLAVDGSVRFVPFRELNGFSLQPR